LRQGIVTFGLGWRAAAPVLVLLFVFPHYMLTSTTAHVSAMMLAFLTVGVQIVTPEFYITSLLMMTPGSTIMMTLMHCATGTVGMSHEMFK
jgi:DASS family divalent anion:Na+ symporter